MLDDDVVARVKARADDSQRPFGEAINELLQIALANPVESDPTFTVEAHAIGLNPGINFNKPHQLLEEMEDGTHQ